jgi:glucose-1-phosphatase
VNQLPDRITTLIFDLGGVIVDLAPEQTLHEFASLAHKPVEEIVRIYTRHAAFYAYETGKIESDEFRDSIRALFELNATDQEIDRCWNAMLLGIPQEKLTMLTNLKKHFTTLAFSNTNSIHLTYINEIILKGNVLDTYFHHAHYSHMLGMRKPEQEIYKYVLKAQGLQADQTFFLDDNVDNINAASAVGIKTLLIEHPDRVAELFKDYE